jgi:hypothetical protein
LRVRSKEEKELGGGLQLADERVRRLEGRGEGKRPEMSWRAVSKMFRTNEGTSLGAAVWGVESWGAVDCEVDEGGGGGGVAGRRRR